MGYAFSVNVQIQFYGTIARHEGHEHNDMAFWILARETIVVLSKQRVRQQSTRFWDQKLIQGVLACESRITEGLYIP